MELASTHEPTESMLARFAWCPDAPTTSRLAPGCSPFSRPCAALFHARVQPFFTPFPWTVGPYHRLATARARSYGNPGVGCLRSKLAAVQGLPASGISGGRAGTHGELRPVWALP